MLHSIQDYARKINSRLTGLDLLSLFALVLFLAGLALYLYEKRGSSNIPISYLTSPSGEVRGISTDGRPFASLNGKTYTFSWCGGSSNISDKNKIYFGTELEAQNSGRTLSKLCQK